MKKIFFAILLFGSTSIGAPAKVIIWDGSTSLGAAEALVLKHTEAMSGLKSIFRFNDGYPKLLETANVKGLKPGYFVIALGVCETREADERLAFLRQIQKGVYARAIEGFSVSCFDSPDWYKVRWPDKAVTGANAELTALLFESIEEDDTLRARKEFNVLVIARGKTGAVTETRVIRSETDFSEVSSAKISKNQLQIEEIFVDKPCDGTTQQVAKRIQRTHILRRKPNGGLEEQEPVDKTLSQNQCKNTESRFLAPPSSDD